MFKLKELSSVSFPGNTPIPYQENKVNYTEKCSLGDPVLDAFFSGGLPVGSITEFVGEAGAAKTQLCFQIMLAVQLPQSLGGLHGGALYMYTEGKPPLQRLKEMASVFHLKFKDGNAFESAHFMDNIFIETAISDGTELLQKLHQTRALLERSSNPVPIRVLIVDSIAYLFRGQEENGVDRDVEGMKERSKILFSISALLRRYADEFNLVVVTTNQVSDSIAQPENKNIFGVLGVNKLVSGGREVVPSLGLAWSQCVNTRVLLSKAMTSDGSLRVLFIGSIAKWIEDALTKHLVKRPTFYPQLRHIQIVFSPYLPQRICSYIVDVGGLRGLHPAETGTNSIAPENCVKVS